VHPTLGSLARFQAVFYTSAFSQSDGVPPPAPARVTQTVSPFLANKLQEENLIIRSPKLAFFKTGVLMSKENDKAVKTTLLASEEQSLTDDLLLEIPSPMFKEAVQSVQINNFLRNWIKKFSNQNKSVNIELNLDAEETTSISINSVFIQSILNILFKNAVQATAKIKEPKIVLSTRRAGDTVEIRVTDNGRGIPEDLRGKLFKKSIGKVESPSGLLLAQKVAEALDGDLSYDDTNLDGTSIKFSLPIKKENLITLTSTISPSQKITPQYLITSIAPYINSLAEIQHIIDDAKGRQFREISVKSIQQNSPISVSLDGASDAIQLVQEAVVPWRRKHAENMSLLLEQEKQVDIESKKAEVLEKRAHAEKDRVEASKQRIEVEKIKLENEKLRLELHREKIQLALDMLKQIAPNLNETEKLVYLVKSCHRLTP